MVYSLCLGLGDDDAGLDEKRAKVAVVLVLEHLEGIAIARCYRDNQRLTASWGFMLQDGVLTTPIVVPAPAPEKGVAEVVNPLVSRDVNHDEPRGCVIEAGISLLLQSQISLNRFRIARVESSPFFCDKKSGEFFRNSPLLGVLDRKII